MDRQYLEHKLAEARTKIDILEKMIEDQTRELYYANIEKQKNYDLEKLAAVGRLAAGVAHEVNNTLAAVMGLAELIRRGIANGSEIKNIIEECKRGRDIVMNLLMFARPMDMRLAPVEISPLLQDVLKLVSGRLTDSGVVCSVIAHPGLPTVHADSSLLKQVFINLIFNACDAMPNGGLIKISAFEDAPWLIIDVVDTGTGIPDELCAKIFEPFFSTKERGKGTGLGLSVAYGIIHRLGGAIRASNAIPAGARFTVKLPAEKGSSAGAALKSSDR